MSLHFEVLGDGRPLVILHGLFGSLENWRSMARKLSAEFQVFSVDQRNHGRSPHLSEMTYELMAMDLLDLLRETNLATPNILGHSMGGKTAMQFALMYPQAVDHLIVVDIAPKIYPPYHRQILDALLAVDLSTMKSRKDLDAALTPVIPEKGVRQFLLKDAKQAEGVFRWQMNVQAISDGYQQLAQAPRGSSFTGPVLFVKGGDSDYILPEDHLTIHRLFPRAETQTILNAGHLLHVEAPEQFFRTVRDFLLAGKTAR